MPSTEMNVPMSTKEQLGNLFVAGGLAGMASKTAVAPFDRIKILCQTGASEGFAKTGTQIIKTEGPLGLWRGNFVNCIRIFPAKGVLYMCSDVYKELLTTGMGMPTGNGWVSVMSGSMSGITASVTTYPLDLIRGRIAGLLGKTNKSIIGIAVDVAKREGVFGLYSGLLPTVLGAIPYEGVKFGVYDLLKRNKDEMPPTFRDLPAIYHSLVFGACSGACASCLLFPNDTVRRIMQIQGALETLGSNKTAYKNMWDCYVQTFKTAGIGRFYHGISANLMRVVPNAAIQFGVYEYGKKLIRENE